jgi:hypothetical protein
MKGKIVDQLDEVSIAIEGALNDPEIMAKLKKLGYNQEVLKEGKVKVEKVRMLSTRQDEGKGLQKSATKRILAARKEIHTLYMRHLSIARIALSQNVELWDIFKLKGERKRTLAGWLGQVNAFYDNTFRIMDVLEKHGISPEEIAQAQAMTSAIVNHKVKQLSGKSTKQRATKQRKAEIKELQAWMSEFLYIARHALKDDKEQLEALGRVV